MGTDGIVEFDQEWWVAFAKYNPMLATGFGVVAVVARTTLFGSELPVIENGVLAMLFGAVRTYAWLSA